MYIWLWFPQCLHVYGLEIACSSIIILPSNHAHAQSHTQISAAAVERFVVCSFFFTLSLQVLVKLYIWPGTNYEK